MSNDISLKNDEEFSTDLTKAVQDIADNVKAGSADFTKGLDSLKSSIEAMQSALVTALNSIKVNIVNNYKSESTKTPKERKSPAEDFGPTRKDFEAELNRLAEEAKPGMPGFVGPKSPYTEKPPKEQFGPSRKDFEAELKRLAEESKPGMPGFVGPQTPYTEKPSKEAYGPSRKEFEGELKRIAEQAKSGMPGFVGPQTPYTEKPSKEQFGPSRKDFEAELKRIFDDMKPGNAGFQGPQITSAQLAYNRQLQEDELKRQYSPGPTMTPEESLKRKQQYEDVSFAVDLQGYIQSLADDFENALGPAIQSVDPYFLDARSNFRAFQEDLDELAQAAKSVSEPIIEMSDSLAELIKEVDTERIMSKAGPKSLKDVFNIVGASAQPNEQNLPEAIPLSSGGPQSLADVFRIVAAATQDIPKAQRVYTKDEIAEMQNKPKVFAQQATEQTSGPWQTLFSNIGSDIQAKKEQEKQKEQDAIGLASGMSFGPSRELFEGIKRANEIGKSFSKTLLNLRNNVSSLIPVFGKILKGGVGGFAIEGGFEAIGKGATNMAVGGSQTAKGAGMAAFGVALAAAGASLNLVTNSAQIASSTIGSFSQVLSKSNPAVLEQVMLIFNDLMGVIGRGLSPVIQYMIPVFRYFADFVDSIVKSYLPIIAEGLPVYKELYTSLIDLSKTILDAILPIMKELSKTFFGLIQSIIPLIQLLIPLVQMLGSVTKALSPVISVVSGAVGLVSKVIGGVTSAVSFLTGSLVAGAGKLTSTFLGWIPGMKSFGESMVKTGKNIAGFEKKPVGIEKGSSFGAAVREVQNVSISGIGDEIRKSALMAGANQLSQEQLLSGINDKLGKDALADAFAAGIAKEKGKKMPAPPLPQKHDVVAGGEFDLGVQPSV